jgi:hypothetical protein
LLFTFRSRSERRDDLGVALVFVSHGVMEPLGAFRKGFQK